MSLLSKKSWNVYSTANIERVRRDEAEAREQERTKEARQAEKESAQRLALLRGEEPLQDEEPSGGPRHHGRPGRVARRKDENQTDYEIRLAQQKQQQQQIDLIQNIKTRVPSREAPIVDDQGHINLIGAQPKALEEPRSRLPDKQNNLPWYNTLEKNSPMASEKPVSRYQSNDPLAMMRKGAAAVKHQRLETEKFVRERNAELDVFDLQRPKDDNNLKPRGHGNQLERKVNRSHEHDERHRKKYQDRVRRRSRSRSRERHDGRRDRYKDRDRKIDKDRQGDRDKSKGTGRERYTHNHDRDRVRSSPRHNPYERNGNRQSRHSHRSRSRSPK